MPQRRTSRTERHVARLCLHTQLGQQADEPGVRPLVIDDEAGVHRDRPAGRVDHDGPNVTARDGIRFEQGHAMHIAKGIGGGEPADARPDDGDVHQARSPAVARSAAAASPSSVRCIPSRAFRAIRPKAPPANGESEPEDPPEADLREVVDPSALRCRLEPDVVDGIHARSRSDEDDAPQRLEGRDPVLHRRDATAHADAESIARADADRSGVQPRRCRHTGVPAGSVREIGDEGEGVLDGQAGVDAFSEGSHGSLSMLRIRFVAS